MSKLKNLKKIINPRFLYALPIAGTGLFCTQQSANAMFNPRNFPRIFYFYATETKRPILSAITSDKKPLIPTTPNINTRPRILPKPTTKPSSMDNIPRPSSNLRLYTKYFFSPYNGPKSSPKTPVSDTKPVTPDVKPRYVSTLNITLNTKPKTTPIPTDLGARPKTTPTTKPSDSDNIPKIDIKPATYVTTGLDAKLKSQPTNENKKDPKYIFKIPSPTKPPSEYQNPKWNHEVNDRIDVPPEVEKKHYNPQNSKFLDILKNRFPASQSNQPSKSRKTSSNFKEAVNNQSSNALKNKKVEIKPNIETKPDITPIYTSPSERTIKKASSSFGEKIKDLSKNTLKKELKNQNKIDNPHLKETLDFKINVGKLSKDTLKNEIDSHLSKNIFKDNKKIEEASDNFGNLMGNIASANLEYYLENNPKKNKSSFKIKSLSKKFGKSMEKISSSELSVRLKNLDQILK